MSDTELNLSLSIFCAYGNKVFSFLAENLILLNITETLLFSVFHDLYFKYWILLLSFQM